MINILLVCGVGMSTSILVKKMKDCDSSNQYKITCSDSESARLMMVDSDIVLIAPHISYLKGYYAQICQSLNIPLLVIEPLDYTKMDGKLVLEKAQTMINIYNQDNPFKVIMIHPNGGIMSNLIVIDMKNKLIGEECSWIFETVSIDDFNDDGRIAVILIEPQIRYENKRIKLLLRSQSTVVGVPSLGLYSTFDGRKVLDFIHKIYNENIERIKDDMKKGKEEL